MAAAGEESYRGGDMAVPSQSMFDEAERRIRGGNGPTDSNRSSLSEPPQDVPFPASSWSESSPSNHQGHPPTTTRDPMVLRRGSSLTPPLTSLIKHRPSYSRKNQAPSNLSNYHTSATSRSITSLPPTHTRCHHQSSYCLPQPVISSNQLSPTLSPSVAAPVSSHGGLLVHKKGVSGHTCRVTRRYRYSRMRRVKRQEYKKLRQMVPALKQKDKVSKVVVIEEAIKYIDELHSALIQRFKSRDIPTTFNGVHLDPKEVHGGNIRELIRRLLANANPNSLPPARIENVRTLPSFLQKLGRHKKS